MKYFCKKTQKEIFADVFKTLWNEFPSFSTVMKCAAEFMRGRENMKNYMYERSGRPKAATSGENVELVHSLIMYNGRNNLRDIARQIDIGFWAVQS